MYSASSSLRRASRRQRKTDKRRRRSAARDRKPKSVNWARVMSDQSSDAACQLGRLAGGTNRYSVYKRDTGVFEVCDDRRLLDSLLQ